MGGGVAATRPRAVPGRDLALDALRGFAILLMVVDHAALFLFHLPLSHPVRLITRLAEPLFVAVFASLLFPRSSSSLLKRLLQILLAALVTNLFFYPAVGKLDVLASFALAYLFRMALPSFLSRLYWLFLLYPFDPTRAFLDYPASIFLSQVAFFLSPSSLRALLYVLFSLPFGSYALTMAFSPLAALLVKHRALLPSPAPLVWVGQRPLLVYATHLPLFILLSWLYL